MANAYRATGLTGGATGALDAKDGTNLAAGDFAIVEDSGTVYFYKLDPSSGAAESSPDVIAPDTNAGDKRWILVDVVMPTHASTHIKGATDEIDGDKVDIDWNPSNSTPETVAQTDSVDHLSSHLKGIDVALGLMVPKALFDAHTIISAATDNTPAAVTVAEQTIVGRKIGGDIAALTASEVRIIINVEDGADVTDAANVNSAGAVMESDYNANTILAATADDTPAALTVAEQTIVGRKTGGGIAALTATEVRTLINVEDGADVTDATNVNSAGAVMESDYNANTILAATADDTPAALTVAEQTIVGRKTGGNITALTATEVRTLINVEDGADVTDAANVASSIHGATGKSDAHDSDEIALIDSEASNVLKKMTIGELKIEIGSGGMSDIVEDTTPQLGGNLDMNQKSFVYDPTPTDDHTWNGHVWTGTAGENLAFGDVCYLKSDGKFWKADADAEATTAGLIAMATAAINADATGVFLRKGFIRDDTWNWTVGAELFVHTTGGNPTATKPSGSGDIVRIVGYAYSADVIWFEPDTAYAEV